jgi:plasmid stabilization system protein ParE
MKITVAVAARADLDEATAYYDAQSPGLGRQFFDEYSAALERIRAYPEAWAKTSARARQCQMKRFPYALIYRVKPDVITVVAIAHMRRKPGYWRNRL